MGDLKCIEKLVPLLWEDSLGLKQFTNLIGFLRQIIHVHNEECAFVHFYLGSVLENGYGCARDLKNAFVHYLKGA